MKSANSWLVPAAVILAAAPASRAELALAVPASVVAGQSVILRAARVDAETQPEWRWRVMEADGGEVRRDGQGHWQYLAPAFVTEERVCHLQVAASDAPLEVVTAAITVAPSGPFALKPLVQLIEDYLGHGLRQPFLELLAGAPRLSGSACGPGDAARFGSIHDLVSLDGHPDPQVRGKWAVVDRANRRILLMAADGTVEPWLGAGALDDDAPLDGNGQHARFHNPTCIAVRPGTPWAAVIVDGGSLRAVDGQGNVTTLAGRHDQHGWEDGPLAKARFGRVSKALFGRDGALYLAEPNNFVIRRVAGEEVGTLAGQPFRLGHADGQGPKALFCQINALALEPKTGDLLVGDTHSLRRVTLDGRVTTLAGARQFGFEDKLAPAQLAGSPCLGRILDLAVHGGQVYITEGLNHALRTFDLETGLLATEIGDPALIAALQKGGQRDEDLLTGVVTRFASDHLEPRFRPGGLRGGLPLPAGAPLALAEHGPGSNLEPRFFGHEGYAYLPTPHRVSFNAQGRALVAGRTWVAGLFLEPAVQQTLAEPLLELKAPPATRKRKASETDRESKRAKTDRAMEEGED